MHKWFDTHFGIAESQCNILLIVNVTIPTHLHFIKWHTVKCSVRYVWNTILRGMHSSSFDWIAMPNAWKSILMRCPIHRFSQIYFVFASNRMCRSLWILHLTSIVLFLIRNLHVRLTISTYEYLKGIPCSIALICNGWLN